LPRGGVEQAGVVGPEPREKRQIMGAGEHVDAVDLEQAEPLHLREQAAP